MSDFQAAYPSPQPPKSSSSKWVWIILLVVVFAMLVCAGLCGGCVFLAGSSADRAHEVAEEVFEEVIEEGVRSVPPFRIALERIKSDSEVKDRLGQPIQESLPAVFNYNESGNGSNAEFKYSITGPKGSAQVHVVGEKIDDQWWYRTLDVTFDDGETIDLADVDIPIQLD